MWSERNVLNSLLWEAAVDDMGIYPRAVVRDGVETPRTEWQDGWNAAVVAVSEKYEKLLTWVRALEPEQSEQLRKLLDSDGEPVHLRVTDGNVELRVLCGDTFAYACSDSESFELAELPEIHRLWDAHGYSGMTAWIARKRQMEPVKEWRQTAGYLKAKADLAAQ